MYMYSQDTTKACTVCPFPGLSSDIYYEVFVSSRFVWSSPSSSSSAFPSSTMTSSPVPPALLPPDGAVQTTDLPRRFVLETVLSAPASRADHWQKRGSGPGNHGVRRPYHIAVSRRPVSSLQMREVIRDATVQSLSR
jgi:hypothetical protein